MHLGAGQRLWPAFSVTDTVGHQMEVTMAIGVRRPAHVICCCYCPYTKYLSQMFKNEEYFKDNIDKTWIATYRAQPQNF